MIPYVSKPIKTLSSSSTNYIIISSVDVTSDR